MMFFIPRFYHAVSKDNNYNLKLKANHKSYITSDNTEVTRFCVYKDESYDGKFIIINNNYYFREDWERERDWVRNEICLKYNIVDKDGHTMFVKEGTDNTLLDIYYSAIEIYVLFKSFDEFKTWLDKNGDPKLIWRVFPNDDKYDLDAHRDSFIQYVKNHFESNDGNIFLLKMRPSGHEYLL